MARDKYLRAMNQPTTTRSSETNDSTMESPSKKVMDPSNGENESEPTVPNETIAIHPHEANSSPSTNRGYSALAELQQQSPDIGQITFDRVLSPILIRPSMDQHDNDATVLDPPRDCVVAPPTNLEASNADDHQTSQQQEIPTESLLVQPPDSSSFRASLCSIAEETPSAEAPTPSESLDTSSSVDRTNTTQEDATTENGALREPTQSPIATTAHQTGNDDNLAQSSQEQQPLPGESVRGLALVQRLRSVMFRRRMSRSTLDVSILQDDDHTAPTAAVVPVVEPSVSGTSDSNNELEPKKEETSPARSTRVMEATSPTILPIFSPVTAEGNKGEDAGLSMQTSPNTNGGSETPPPNSLENSGLAPADDASSHHKDLSDDNEYQLCNSFVDDGEPPSNVVVQKYSVATDEKDGEETNDVLVDPLQKALTILQPPQMENDEENRVSILESHPESPFKLQNSIDSAPSDLTRSQHTLDSSFESAAARSFEINKTTEEIGATSKELMQHLRGASYRRKMNLARSRDSLAAKERQQHEVNAALEAARRKQNESVTTFPSRPVPVKKVQPGEGFIARPLPKTTGVSGSGGLAGVPKVEKKPTTTPISPFLGAKRQAKALQAELEETTTASNNAGSNMKPGGFKALPLPKTNGSFGGAGQVGVPKVQKRQVTVPQSPLLGARRPLQKDKIARSSLPPQVGRPSHGSLTSTSSQGSLVGLQLCTQKENDNLVSTPSAPTNVTKGYVPHSTDRARRRASFDTLRVQHERERKVKEQEERKARVRALRKELGELCQSI